MEYLKEHDPIHYCEMMGDPVTGIRNESTSNIEVILIIITLLTIGFVIAVSVIEKTI